MQGHSQEAASFIHLFVRLCLKVIFFFFFTVSCLIYVMMADIKKANRNHCHINIYSLSYEDRCG